MSDALIGTLSGLCAAIFWGISDWLAPRSKDKLSFWQINFVIGVAGFLSYVLLFALTGPHSWPAADIITTAVIGSALVCSGYIFFIKALTIGAVGIVAPLSSIYPMLTLALSVILLGQVFTMLQVAAMGLVLLGAVLLAYEKNHHKLPLRQMHAATIYSALAVIAWGVGFFLINPLFEKAEWQVLLVILDTTGLLIALAVMLAAYKRNTIQAIKRATRNSTAWAAGLLLAVGTAGLYIGASNIGNVIIPVVIASVSPLLAGGLELVVDKRQLGWSKWAGAVVAVTGIVVLSL